MMLVVLAGMGAIGAMASPVARVRSPDGARMQGSAASSVCVTAGSKVSAPSLSGPSYYLSGDGGIIDYAFEEHIAQVSRDKVNVVVLAASAGTTPTPECDIIVGSSKVGSCTTCTLLSVADANDPTVEAAVGDAGVVFFSGGDQCKYVGWRNTTTFTAVTELVKRGGGVGGGSAGLAIQGSTVYDACTGSVFPDEALEDPYNQYMSFTDSFFNWDHLSQTITDSHFYQRDRMGRLMTFVARQIEDGRGSSYLGIGVDEESVLLVDKAGLGKLRGKLGSSSYAHMVLGDHEPTTCRKGQPLSYSNFKIWRLRSGDTFDFRDRPTTGFYTVSVSAGNISSDPYLAHYNVTE